MRKRMKQSACFLLCALLLGIFCACGGTDEHAGVYVCTGASVQGQELPPEAVYPAGAELRLESGGRGTLTVNGEGGEIRWSLKDGNFTLDTGSESSFGTFEDGVISLSLFDSGVLLRFVKQGGETEDGEADDASWQAFSGGWYGWWKIENSDGAFPESWFDCCAMLIPGEDGGAVLTLWDEDSSQNAPMALVKLKLDENGKAVSSGGWFWYAELGEGEWTLDTASAPLPDMLCLQGCHESGQGIFDYTIYLRPWGMLWEDAEQDAPDMLPYHYFDWYLPLIGDGADMPGEIGK